MKYLKHIVTCLILCISLLPSYGSSIDTTDSNKIDTCFTQQEILNLDNHIQDMKDSLVIYKKLVIDQDSLISLLNYRIERDSIKHNTEIYLLNRKLEVTEEISGINLQLYETTKPKWYEKRWVGFVSGMVMTLGSSWVVKNTL